MRREATDRLLVASVLGLAGALVAVLAGMAEVALFVAPWMVLCVLGATRPSSGNHRVEIDIDRDRVVVGDAVNMSVRIRSDHGCRVRVQPIPSRSFSAGTGSGAVTEPPAVVALAADDVGTDADEACFEMEAHSWGTHDLGRVALEVREPFGLFRSTGSASVRRPLRVHPTPRELSDLITPWVVRRVSGTHPSPESARGIEYADIREFGPGDSVRDINWRASARSNGLLVSQRHPDRASDVILLVDSFVESGHDVRSVFGLVIEAAVALADSHLAATDRVGLIEFGGLVRWVTPGTGSVQLQRLTDALLSTGLYANAADKELPILPPRAMPPRSLVVAFTPLLDDRFIDAVFTARGRGHDVAVITCEPTERLPAGGGASGSGTGPGTDAERVALRIWSAERAMTRDRMAEHGIAVVSWDGTEPIDMVLGRLRDRRRRTIRTGGAR